MSDLAARWLRVVPSLREAGLRAAAVSSELERSPIELVVEALEAVSVLAEQADPAAREVLTAAMPLLTDPARAAFVEALRSHAQAAGKLSLGRLLRSRGGLRDGAHEVPDPSERQASAAASSGRALTLGERKALARGRDRFMLDRLLRDPHPQVIRNVLGNPRVTEEDIVRLAARRPTFPDVQAEIAKSPRWGVRARVRLALVHNPYTPTSIAIPLLSLLLRGELAHVVEATDLPPIVRASAAALLERRPPVPAPEEPGTPH